jgi:hypothetical protein
MAPLESLSKAYTPYRSLAPYLLAAFSQYFSFLLTFEASHPSFIKLSTQGLNI